jgi:hypothetical protein
LVDVEAIFGRCQTWFEVFMRDKPWNGSDVGAMVHMVMERGR